MEISYTKKRDDQLFTKRILIQQMHKQLNVDRKLDTALDFKSHFCIGVCKTDSCMFECISVVSSKWKPYLSEDSELS